MLVIVCAIECVSILSALMEGAVENEEQIISENEENGEENGKIESQ